MSSGHGVAQAASAGANRAELAKEAAEYLVASTNADRIGVWIQSTGAQNAENRGVVGFRGIVVDRDRSDIPAEWERLSPEPPLPADLLGSRKSIEQDLDAYPVRPLLGALVGMQRALWVPVQKKGQLHGVLLAGMRKRGPLPRGLLEQVAADLALALELEDERRLARERLADMTATRQLLGTLGREGSTDAVMAAVAEGCTLSPEDGGIGAAFAVLRVWGDDSPDGNEIPFTRSSLVEQTVTPGRALERRSRPTVWQSGDVTWLRALENEPQTGIWHRAREARHTITSEMSVAGSTTDLARITVIPLEIDDEPLGAFAMHFSHGAPSPTTLERLELRAGLAAVTLHLRKRSSQAARQAAQQQTLLEATTGAALLVDPQGRIAAMSGGAQELLQEILQGDRGTVPAESVPPRQFAELFRARDQQNVIEWLRRAWSARATDGAGDEQQDAELHSGIRVRLRCVAPPAGLLAGVAIEPVAAQDTVRAERAEAQLVNVVEWLEEGVVLFDAKHEIRVMNTRFAQIAGLAPEETSRIRTLNGLIARLASQAAQPEHFAERWRDQARGGEGGVREEIQLLRPVPRVLERAARPVTDATGRHLGRVEIYRDLTAQRVFQSKLLQTEKLAALGQMVTGVAHELSNPLTSILGYAQRLLVAGNAGRGDEIQRVYQEAERASTIVRQLLNTARDAKPERRKVDLNQIVSRTLDLQRFSLAAEQVRVEQDLDPSLPPVLGDAGQLQQVLMNLIGNARQAIEQRGKGGAIRLRTKCLSDTRVLLEVSDDGPGIPEAIRARIFDPFFTTKPAGIGTGLGLAIVLGIVREHGGQVHVASPPRGGATFTLEFPAARSEAPRSEAPRVPPLPATGPSTGARELGRPRKASSMCVAPPRASRAKCRVLVVEDEPTVAQLIGDVLKDDGLQVDVLLDGREALERVAHEAYDLVICDMKMPGLDGQHFYRSLVDSGNPLQKKFLFVTGDVIAAHTHEFLERHQLPHVAKPFRVEELTEKVRRVLAATSPREPLPAPLEKTNVARK